jgi:hypothetical protein
MLCSVAGFQQHGGFSCIRVSSFHFSYKYLVHILLLKTVVPRSEIRLYCISLITFIAVTPGQFVTPFQHAYLAFLGLQRDIVSTLGTQANSIQHMWLQPYKSASIFVD